MGKYEDLVERVRETDEDLADELEQFKGSSLRSKAERTDSLETENSDLKARILELEEAPKREKAFKEFGVDLDALSVAETEILSKLKVEGDLTAEKVGEIVSKYNLPMTSNEGATEEGEASAAEQIAKAASRPTPPKGGSPTITPEQAAEWPTEKWMRFESEHAEAAEKLSQGEQVTGIAFQ